jgi:hypothetical protein
VDFPAASWPVMTNTAGDGKIIEPSRVKRPGCGSHAWIVKEMVERETRFELATFSLEG